MIRHLSSRCYDVDRYPTQWITPTQLTVPLFGFNGKLLGYQRYTRDAPKQTDNPTEARYFTRMYEHGQSAVWGTECPISMISGQRPTVFLTESVFKASAMHRAGYHAWAILGSCITPMLRQQLLLLPYRYVCAGDDDPAGIKFSRTFRHGFVSHDLDELSIDDIRMLAQPFIPC